MTRKRLLKKSILVLLTATCYLLLATGLTLAQEPDYDRINEIARNLNCPTCSGLNLADCRTLTCEQWRGRIGDMLREGYSSQEILDDFVARYGEQVLQSPPKRGFTLLLWVLPFVALLAGGIWLVYILRGWTNRQPPLPATVTTAPINPDRVSADSPVGVDDYLQQVEQDLGIDQG